MEIRNHRINTKEDGVTVNGNHYFEERGTEGRMKGQQRVTESFQPSSTSYSLNIDNLELIAKKKKHKSEVGMVYLTIAGLSVYLTFYLLAGSYGNPYYFFFFQLAFTAFMMVNIIIILETLNDDVFSIPRWLNPTLRRKIIKEKVIKGFTRGFLLIGVESVLLFVIIKILGIQPSYEKIPAGPHREYVIQQYLQPHQPTTMEFLLLVIAAVTLVGCTVAFGWWGITRFITFYKYNEKRGLLEIKKIPLFLFFLPLLLLVVAIVNTAVIGFYYSVKTNYPTFPSLLQPLIPFADTIFVIWVGLLAVLGIVLYRDGEHALQSRRFVTPEFEEEVKRILKEMTVQSDN